MRFRQAGSGRGLQALAFAALAIALAAFAAVSLAASRSGAAPPPIRCAPKLPPTLDEATCPIQGKTVDVAPVSGRVFFTAPGDVRRLLDEPHAVPITTIIDATRGRFRMTANERSVGIRNATADFFGGRAEILQGTGRNATVHLQLAGEKLAACGTGARATASRSHRKLAHLWGTGKGHFGITGHYASAIVQGTKWRLTDFCDGSGVTVTRGTVRVTDFTTGKTVLVSAGQSYFASSTPQRFVFPTVCPRTNVPVGSTATITGTFTPPNPSPAPQVDYTAPSGAVTRHTLVLDAAGNFSDSVTANERGLWSVSVHLANAAPGGTPATCSFLVV